MFLLLFLSVFFHSILFLLGSEQMEYILVHFEESNRFQTNKIPFIPSIPILESANRTDLNPLTPRVKPWLLQSFLTFGSMDRTLKCDHSLESC